VFNADIAVKWITNKKKDLPQDIMVNGSSNVICCLIDGR
jgi:hypothetical protein